MEIAPGNDTAMTWSTAMSMANGNDDGYSFDHGYGFTAKSMDNDTAAIAGYSYDQR